MSEPLISMRNITFAYQGCEPVLKSANFFLMPGERLALTGSNGCGKSTLLSIIVGLKKPQQSEIEVLGRTPKHDQDFSVIRRRVGLVFQHSDDQLFCPTVLEDIAFGPLNLGKTPKEAILIAREALHSVGMAEFENRITYKLSGGEKRLIAIATVLAMNPDILLLDEPTTGLDIKAKTRLSKVLSSLPQSMVIVSHEHDFASDLATSCIEMTNGAIECMNMV